MSNSEPDADDELRRALTTASESWEPDTAKAQLELSRRAHPPGHRQTAPRKTQPVWLVPLATVCFVAALITGISVIPELLDSSSPAPEVATARPGLTFTRQDGSTFEVSDFTVRCHVADNIRLMTIRSHLEVDSAGEHLVEPYAELEAVVADVAEPGTRIEFPPDKVRPPVSLPESGSYPPPTARVFAVDAETDNELNSNESESSGSVVFERATCEPDAGIEVVIDATLGSEVEMETVDVSGILRIEADR